MVLNNGEMKQSFLKWKYDLSWSAKCFNDLVWPVLQQQIGGDLIHVEQITDSIFAKDFDMLSGIDAWHIKNDEGIRGIASRVQVVAPRFDTYKTFTIRKERDSGAKTEYEKRKNAIISNDGWLYPHLTVQAYVSDRENGYLRDFAVGITRDIFKAIENGNCWINRTTNASFYCVSWCPDVCFYEYHEAEF